MTKVHLLGANKSYDRSVQTVSVNQVVVLEGYSYDSYVVYEVSRNGWGITYHLINLRTYEFHTSDLIRPLSEKFGIGIYYDDANPRFLDPLETAALLTKAKEKKAEEEKKVARLVKVKVKRRFRDMELNQIKDAGDAYTVSRERAAVLEEAGVAAVIEE